MSGFDQLDKFAVPVTREKVVISRHWDNPDIRITVNATEIKVICDLEDLLIGICEELKDPAMMWREAGDEGKSAWVWIRTLFPNSYALDHTQLQQNIRLAAKIAIEKIKEATCQVM
jgi:hypothetical protein